MEGVARLIDDLDAATARLGQTVRPLDAAQIDRPALLPGWTVGHVLTHIARNADGLRNLLLAARSGHELKMYASPAARAADIEAGAHRNAEVIIADSLESSARFVVDARAMPDEAWSATVAFTSGQPNPPIIPAERLLVMRLEEVEVHHVDLGLGYTFADSPPQVVMRLLDRLAARRHGQGVSIHVVAQDIDWRSDSTDHDAPTVQGPGTEILGWITGRAHSGLTVDGTTRQMPPLPPLG